MSTPVDSDALQNGATLPELFDAQVTRNPAAIALAFGAARLTYGELGARANRLAHRLIGLGVGPGIVVGVLLDRSPDLVIAVLAILKAGAAYLPLDLDYPEPRLAQMLADADPMVVVTVADLRSRLPQAAGQLVLDAPEVQAALLADPAHNPSDTERTQPLLPGCLAYIIYTSGSTGIPKGVMVPHRNVVRLLGATQRWFEFGPADVWTLFHSYAFDFSVWELWGALLYGGRLVIVPKVLTRSPNDFLALLVSEGVTVLNQTPSAFYQLMQADAENTGLGDGLNLRCVIFGGEALELQHLKTWYNRHADHEPLLVNMYGITETTVHVTYLALDRAVAANARGRLIGSSIPDLRVFVLDSRLEPAPIGVPGEMYVAGEGLADGYLNRPSLTAERFVACPFGRPGERMYRTGDLAQQQADGTLEFLGRSDRQVKIRGFRVEPGDIEAALTDTESVLQAAVVVRDDGPRGRELVAYLVPVAGARIDLGGLVRSLAKQRLPEYMVPSAFVTLARLPLTGNGKLDQQALPAPQPDARPRASPVIAARNHIEAELIAIWQDMLAVPVGREDNFFDLGGNSLALVKLHAEIARRIQADIQMMTLFRFPTIAGLALHLAERGSGGGFRGVSGEDGRDRAAKQAAALRRVGVSRSKGTT